MKSIFAICVIALSVLGCNDNATQSSSNNSTREVYGVLIKKVTIVDNEITLSVECIVPDPGYGYSHSDSYFAGKKINLTVYTMPTNPNGAVQVLSSFKEDIKIKVPSAGEYTIHYRYSYDEMRDTVLTVK